MTALGQDTRVDLSTLLAGVGALLLLVSLFFDWYGNPDGHGGLTAWDAFELVDLLLAALALAVLYEIASGFSGDRRWPSAVALATLAGPAALVLVVVSMIDDPPLVSFVESDLELGIWLALAGALLMTVGAFLTRVRVAFVVSPRDRTRTPPPPPPTPPHDPDTETRPLP